MHQKRWSSTRPGQPGLIRRRIVTWTVNIGLLVMTSLSLAYLYWVYVDDQFLAIVGNNVYRSANMSPDELLEFVTDRNIRSVINLCASAPDVLPDEQTLISKGVRPINITSEPIPGAESVERFLDIMEDVSNYPVLLYCQHSFGPSSLFEAIYRIEFLGWSNMDARQSAYVRRLSEQFGLNDVRGQYLLSYQPRARHNMMAFVASRIGGATN